MASHRFQVIVAGTKIGFAVKPLRSVSRKFTKAWIATVRDLCIDFDISGHANLTSDAIPAPSAFISTLPGKYQVLLRTDSKTLEWQEGTPKLLSMTIESAPFGTDCKRVLRLPGFRNCRYDPAYPVTAKYPSDSTWTPGDFRLDIAAANAMLFSCSIPSRKRSGKPTNSAHVLYATTPPWKRHRSRASLGVGSIPMGDVVTMLDVRRRFEIPAALCQPRSRKIALATQIITGDGFRFHQLYQDKQCHHLRSTRALISALLFGWMNPLLSRSISMPLSFTRSKPMLRTRWSILAFAKDRDCRTP